MRQLGLQGEEVQENRELEKTRLSYYERIIMGDRNWLLKKAESKQSS